MFFNSFIEKSIISSFPFQLYTRLNWFEIQNSKNFLGRGSLSPLLRSLLRSFLGFTLDSGSTLKSRLLCTLDSGFTRFGSPRLVVGHLFGIQNKDQIKLNYFFRVFNKFLSTSWCLVYMCYPGMGPSIKYVTLQGGRGSEKVWQFVTEGGKDHVTSHFQFFHFTIIFFRVFNKFLSTSGFMVSCVHVQSSFSSIFAW